MAGTIAGGKKAAKTNLERQGEDFYSRIGRKGGQNGCGPDYMGGFAANRALASIAGRRGGLKSSRKGIKNGQGKSSKTIEQREVKAESGMMEALSHAE